MSRKIVYGRRGGSRLALNAQRVGESLESIRQEN